MFQVSQHPSSGVLKTVTAATGTATSLQRGLIDPTRCNSMHIFIYCKVTLHVSGVTAPIMSTKNCNRSHRYSYFPPTWPDQATLEGSSCTSIMTCTTSSPSSSVWPMANATDVLQPIGLLYLLYPPHLFRRSHVCRQYPHVHDDVRDPSSERWNYVGEN